MAKKSEPSVNELDILIGENIKAILKERNLKSTPFSDDIKMERGYFSELINGKKRWNTDAILKVADGLMLQPYEILANQQETALLRALKEQISIQVKGIKIREEIAKERSYRKPSKT